MAECIVLSEFFIAQPLAAGDKFIAEKTRELIKLSKDQGYLTFDDLEENLPSAVNDPDVVMLPDGVRVVMLAEVPKAVSTFTPLRALTSTVYCVVELNPVTVRVPQAAAVCHTAVAPSRPFAWT